MLAIISTLVSSNLLINAFMLERYFAPDGHLVPASKRLLFAYNFASVAVALGLTLLLPRLAGFRFAVRLHHAVLAMLLLEGFLRLTIFTQYVESSLLENPRLYASGDCGDDDYYVLAHYYHGELPPQGETDPALGWTVGLGELGVITDKYLSMEDVKQRPALFFGDSFVVWGATMGEKIPQIVDELLPQFDVLNYGVGGYGTDQISLRFQREFPRFADRRPLVLIGITLDDLDRALLRYRSAQKPYFVVEDGVLVLHPPRYRTNKEFFDAYHFHSKSFALSLLAAPVRKLLRTGDECAKERYELNLPIIEDMVSFARAHRIDAYVVIFYSHNDLARLSSREKELKQILDSVEFTQVIDTKELLLRHADRAGTEPVEFYGDGGGGHHTAEANRIIARGIVAYLRAARADVE